MEIDKAIVGDVILNKNTLSKKTISKISDEDIFVRYLMKANFHEHWLSISNLGYYTNLSEEEREIDKRNREKLCLWKSL
jgi:hypothetical protein